MAFKADSHDARLLVTEGVAGDARLWVSLGWLMAFGAADHDDPRLWWPEGGWWLVALMVIGSGPAPAAVRCSRCWTCAGQWCG